MTDSVLSTLPQDVVREIFSRVPDLRSCAQASKTLLKCLAGEIFLNLWFLRQHSTWLPHTPWQYAALQWHPLRRLPPQQLAEWLAAHAAVRARHTGASGEDASLKALAPIQQALAAGDVVGALTALCPRAEQLLLVYAAHAGRDDVVQLLLAPAPHRASNLRTHGDQHAEEQPQQPQKQAGTDDQEKQPPAMPTLIVLPDDSMRTPVDPSTARVQVDLLDLAMRAALVGRRPQALKVLCARKRAAAAPPAGGPPAHPNLRMLHHAVGCSDVECLRVLCSPQAPWVGAPMVSAWEAGCLWCVCGMCACVCVWVCACVCMHACVHACARV